MILNTIYIYITLLSYLRFPSLHIPARSIYWILDVSKFSSNLYIFQLFSARHYYIEAVGSGVGKIVGSEVGATEYKVVGPQVLRCGG